MRAVAIAAVALFAACAQPEPGHAFNAGSDQQAKDVVKAFLEAAKAGDANAVADQLCDKTDDGRARATAALAGPLHISRYEITRVEPAWVGAEPYFRVDVALHKAGTTVDARSLSVRAREGCVDRLLGEPVEAAQRPHADEISL